MDQRELHIEDLTNGIRTGSGRELVLQQNVNATLQQGSLICLLGPNGAGKSTLIRSLSGLQKPLSGKIFFSGKELGSMSLKARSREVAVVLTGKMTDPFLTAFEVVSMGRFPYASFYGRLKKNDVEMVHETMEMLGVLLLKDKIFQSLSDGEKQKILLARALVQDTPFLFLDEPVAFIDSPGKIEIMEWLSRIAHVQNKGILITTHDIELALDYADMLWLMNREIPFYTGIPEDLVLKGIVNRYFDRSHVVFDKFRGRFGVETKGQGKVLNIQGSAIEMQWLVRAFLRMGWETKKVTSTQKPEFYYSFDGNRFRFTEKGTDTFFKSIEEVLTWEGKRNGTI